jgi:hypothetical protein
MLKEARISFPGAAVTIKMRFPFASAGNKSQGLTVIKLH